MDEMTAIMFDTAQRLLADLGERAGVWEDMSPAALDEGWQPIEESGLPLALVDEEHGGLGLPLAEGLELARIAGENPVPWPLVETMLARRFAASSGEEIPAGPVASPGDLAPDQRNLAALARAKQMSGALEAVLTMTITQVQERSQFGRPLAKFQAIQHSLAILAGEVAAARAAADHAVMRLDGAEGDVLLAIGIARARVGEAASRASAIAHQLHGAIGFTREHRLHRYTTALWAWRDQFGTQAWWTRQVGRAVIANGRDGFWPMVTAA